MKRKESLRDYTNEELYQFMEVNEVTDTMHLGCFCSEILRRMIEGTWELKRCQPIWISVKDRLPKQKEFVGYTYDGKNIRRDVYYNLFSGTWESDDRTGWHSLAMGWYKEEQNTTHWMELPEPPTDNK
jgi:hypothetical protein